MKTFNVKEINELEIRVLTTQELIDLYKTIVEDEENFIITDGKESKVILCHNLVSKVNDGTTQLVSGTKGGM